MIRRFLPAVTIAAALLGGCTYELKGRVVEEGFDSMTMVAADDGRLEEGKPVKGARLVVTRDPNSLARRDVASAVSDGNGWFTLRLDETGSGFTDEVWGVRVARTGFSGVEETIRLPFDPKSSRLLVTLSPGPSRRGPERGAGAGADVQSDVDRFSSSPTGRAP